MIAQLEGPCVQAAKGKIVISINGIGFEVLVPEHLSNSALPGEKCLVFTQLMVRDNEMYLVGFASSLEREVFRLLISVTGVGPKLALKMLSVLSPEALLACVANNDLVAITKIPGVGKKTGQRLMLELSGKFQALVGEEVGTDNMAMAGRDLWLAAGEVLVSFGCAQDEAQQALEQVRKAGEFSDSSEANVDSLVMAAFKVLGQK